MRLTYLDRQLVRHELRPIRWADVPAFLVCESVDGMKQLLVHRSLLEVDGRPFGVEHEDGLFQPAGPAEFSGEGGS